MYKLLRTVEGIMDRFIYLKNEETGTVDYCFDYAVGSFEGDFSFMKIDEKYDCKIMLVGDQVSKEKKGTQQFCYNKASIQKIGSDEYLKVRIKEDSYYIRCDDVKHESTRGFFYYNYFRKDLLEVNGIVTPRYR